MIHLINDTQLSIFYTSNFFKIGFVTAFFFQYWYWCTWTFFANKIFLIITYEFTKHILFNFNTSQATFVKPVQTLWSLCKLQVNCDYHFVMFSSSREQRNLLPVSAAGLKGNEDSGNFALARSTSHGVRGKRVLAGLKLRVKDFKI